MSTTADDYQSAREKLAELTDGEVGRIARFRRPADPALTTALAEELARRGLRLPGIEEDAAIEHARRTGAVRARRF